MAEKRHYPKRDYVEWDSQAEKPRERPEDIFDSEIRRRIGELIARALDESDKPKH